MQRRARDHWDYMREGTNRCATRCDKCMKRGALLIAIFSFAFAVISVIGSILFWNYINTYPWDGRVDRHEYNARLFAAFLLAVLDVYTIVTFVYHTLRVCARVEFKEYEPLVPASAVQAAVVAMDSSENSDDGDKDKNTGVETLELEHH